MTPATTQLGNSHVIVKGPHNGPDVTIGNDLPFMLFAGPCAMESRTHALEMAEAIKQITTELGIGFVYKSSFDKANRTSLGSKRGVGLDEALPIFAEIRETLGVPCLTDIHERQQCAPVAEVVDVLQIPAFLCRQTDLLLAAAATGRTIKIKKGQFPSPRRHEECRCQSDGRWQPECACDRARCQLWL